MADNQKRTYKSSRLSFATPDTKCETIAEYVGEILRENGYWLRQISFCPHNIEVPSIVYENRTKALKVTLFSDDDPISLSTLPCKTGSAFSTSIRETQMLQLAIVVLIFRQDVKKCQNLLKDIGTKYTTIKQLFELDIIFSDDLKMIFDHFTALNLPTF